MQLGTTNTERCLAAVRSWMSDNMLMLNDSKTEFTVFGSKQQLAKVTLPAVTMGKASISPSPAGIRSLGVSQDPLLSLDRHVQDITRSANFHIRNVCRLRRYLTKKASLSLIHAFVTSRLDENNAILSGVKAKLI